MTLLDIDWMTCMQWRKKYHYRWYSVCALEGEYSPFQFKLECCSDADFVQIREVENESRQGEDRHNRIEAESNSTSNLLSILP